MKYLLLILLLLPLSLDAQNESEKSSFFNFVYDEDSGTVMLEIEKLNKEFLYVNSLAAGVGSNDLGLDRGKLHDTRIVKFIKEGNKILLLQPNMDFRAVSKNQEEVRAVREAFAESILWGFTIKEKKSDTYIIDLTPFLLSDANGIGIQLKDANQGTYKLDKNRCAVKSNGLFSFPRNTEFESRLTFTGDAKGNYIKSVTPSSNAVSIVQHQSFIALPEDGYQPRKYHPYSGYFNISYSDYATPIHEPIEKRFIQRHRLEKKDPQASISEAKEPIVYYVDSGCPEPVKSALIEGASWWNQAFTEAGFKDAFVVKELPADAHPLDVRYNVIQWVHRSTRGWSYGASITDPRTGEIIKGHVSLGSLRVRQDFMIAQGILSSYKNNKDHGPMTELALARLRQLSAHEVGHTIGLAHNFAASVNDRASVMDYPHPLITLNSNKTIDLSNAYDDKIGKWDRRAVVYGYTQFGEGEEDSEGLLNILKETKKMGLLYMSDPDARPMGSAHPRAHLWDNGEDPVVELKRIMQLRQNSLERLGEQTIVEGTPFSELEKILVPAYLMHRYQTEAASKVIGGVDYNYAVKGHDEILNDPISEAVQNQALQVILNTLSPQELSIPQSLLETITPSAYGYYRNRESFGSNTNLVFDPFYPAEAYSNFALSLLLHPDRLARINQQSSLNRYMNTISKRLFTINQSQDDQLAMIPQKTYVIHLIKLAMRTDIDKQVASMALREVNNLQLSQSASVDWEAHNDYLKMLINNMRTIPNEIELPTLAKMPPGSPIGCE